MYLNIFIFSCLFSWVTLRYLQFRYVNTLSGDNITHLLFHNLVKNNMAYNPAGIVGSGRLNLPLALYRISAFILPKYFVGKSILLPSMNVFILIIIEVILFGALYLQTNDIAFAFTATLAFSFFPAFGLITTIEAGSYLKFSERMPALFANSLLAVLLNSVIELSLLVNYALILVTLCFSCVLGKFSRQVVVMVFTSFVVINFRLDYMLVVCGGILFLLLQKHFRSEVIAHLKYLQTYKNFQSQNFEVSEERLLNLGIPGVFRRNRLFRIYLRLLLHSGLNIILCFPTVIYVFYYGTPDVQALVVIVIIYSIATTTHFLYFVGPGFRYLYNVLPLLLITQLNYDANTQLLLLVNLLITIISIFKNHKKIRSKIDDTNNKILAFTKIKERVVDHKTIFFDHYKDAEIFQLICGTNVEIKLSTSRDYSWTAECKKIFSKYPWVDFSESTLKTLTVAYVISIKSDLKIDGARNIYQSDGYNLYEITSNAET